MIEYEIRISIQVQSTQDHEEVIGDFIETRAQEITEELHEDIVGCRLVEYCTVELVEAGGA